MNQNQSEASFLPDLPIEIVLKILFLSLNDTLYPDGSDKIPLPSDAPMFPFIFLVIIEKCGEIWFYKNMHHIITYLITHDSPSPHALTWILGLPERENLYLDIFLRFTLSRLKEERIDPNSRDNWRIIRMIDTFTYLGRLDLIDRIIEPKSDFMPFIPVYIKEIICFSASHHSQLAIGEKYMKENDGQTINMLRAHIIFRGALNKGRPDIYEYLFDKIPGIIDWHDASLEYFYAENSLINMSNARYVDAREASLRFLLKNDPQTHHLSPTFKAVICTRLNIYPYVRWYRLRLPLPKEECVSQRSYYDA